jgi:hypothetical protein
LGASPLNSLNLTVRELASNHNTQAKKTPKTNTSGSPTSPDPHGAARPYAITLWRTPAKLMGDLALPLLDTPIEAPHAIFIIFNEYEGIPTPQQIFCCFH